MLSLFSCPCNGVRCACFLEPISFSVLSKFLFDFAGHHPGSLQFHFSLYYYCFPFRFGHFTADNLPKVLRTFHCVSPLTRNHVSGTTRQRIISIDSSLVKVERWNCACPTAPIYILSPKDLTIFYDLFCSTTRHKHKMRFAFLAWNQLVILSTCFLYKNAVFS